jgi:hypothetical protein
MDFAKAAQCHVYDRRSHFPSVTKLASTIIESGGETASFLMVNLRSIVSQWMQWQEQLPMVEPFYGTLVNACTVNF